MDGVGKLCIYWIPARQKKCWNTRKHEYELETLTNTQV